LQADAAGFPEAAGKLFRFFAEQVVGFDDADAVDVLNDKSPLPNFPN
jgi:hypothetical protein